VREIKSKIIKGDIMMNNIPTYRAKKIDSDEYIEGILLPQLERYDSKSFIVNKYTRFQGLSTSREIDPSTLAIHFPSMIDSKGKKIFASLDSENGIGGDVVIGIEYKDYNNASIDREVTVVFKSNQVGFFRHLFEETLFMNYDYYTNLKIIGIQK